MSAIEIRDAGWQAIMDDERLAGARRKLSFHEIRLIVDHARVTPPLDSEAVERVRAKLEYLRCIAGHEVLEEHIDEIITLLSLANPIPVSGEAVERVAEALWRAEWAEGFEPPHSWDVLCAEDPEIVEAWRHSARAALTAMKGTGR